MSRIESPRRTRRPPSPSTARCATTSVSAREQLGHERLRRLTDLRDLAPAAPPRRSAPGAGENRCATPTRSCASPADTPAGAHTRTPQPRVELVLHGPLDDQPRTQLRQLRQRLARVSPTPTANNSSICSSSPPMAVRCVSRRRPPSIVLPGLEGTYAVALTAPALFTALRDATSSRRGDRIGDEAMTRVGVHGRVFGHDRGKLAAPQLRHSRPRSRAVIGPLRAVHHEPGTSRFAGRSG